MLPLAAVVLDAIGTRPASFAELAGSSSAIPLIMVKAGADAAPLLNNRRVIEALQLQGSVLMLFEDQAEAEAFEKAAQQARKHAERARAAALAQKGRRFMSTRR